MKGVRQFRFHLSHRVVGHTVEQIIKFAILPHATPATLEVARRNIRGHLRLRKLFLEARPLQKNQSMCCILTDSPTHVTWKECDSWNVAYLPNLELPSELGEISSVRSGRRNTFSRLRISWSVRHTRCQFWSCQSCPGFG